MQKIPIAKEFMHVETTIAPLGRMHKITPKQKQQTQRAAS
jgi:hypothetical protein